MGKEEEEEEGFSASAILKRDWAGRVYVREIKVRYTSSIPHRWGLVKLSFSCVYPSRSSQILPCPTYSTCIQNGGEDKIWILGPHTFRQPIYYKRCRKDVCVNFLIGSLSFIVI